MPHFPEHSPGIGRTDEVHGEASADDLTLTAAPSPGGAGSGARRGPSSEFSGRTLGHFEMLELVGAGGFGEVYRARDTRLDRIVAINLTSAFHTTAAALPLMRARGWGRVINVAVLVATGVNADGHREILGVQVNTGETGAGALEMAEARYMIRIDGRLRGLDDLRNIPITPRVAPAGASGMAMGTQVYEPFKATRSVFRLGDIAEIRLGPEMREGIAELDGQGEVAGGIVLMRPGGNALKTIAGVKAKLAELAPSLPEGVELVEVYDRSGLIHRAIDPGV